MRLFFIPFKINKYTKLVCQLLFKFNFNGKEIKESKNAYCVKIKEMPFYNLLANPKLWLALIN